MTEPIIISSEAVGAMARLLIAQDNLINAASSKCPLTKAGDREYWGILQKVLEAVDAARKAIRETCDDFEEPEVVFNALMMGHPYTDKL